MQQVLGAVPQSYAATREALHAVAEHVAAPARYAVEQRIGLRATPGGFGTPEFGERESVRVDRTDVVVFRKGEQLRSPLTTLREAAEFVGITAGALADVYQPSTPLELDAPLLIDPDAAEFLAEWFAFSWEVLEASRAEGLRDASIVQLWPEHFDAAFEQGGELSGRRAGYGASPGDEANPEPYFYVVPWSEQPENLFWNAPSFSGAVLPYAELLVATNPPERARAFLREGLRLLSPPG